MAPFDEMPGLGRHILLDAVRRNWIAAIIITVWSCMLACQWLVGKEYPSFPPFYVLAIFGILIWTLALLHVDKYVLLCLPLSRSNRGRYAWWSSLLAPLLALVPMLLAAMVFPTSAPYATTVLLTAIVSFPAAFLMMPLGQRVLGQPLGTGGSLPLFLVPFLGCQYANYLLYARLNFPWFFLLLAPFTIVGLWRSYRRVHLLGIVPFRCQSERASVQKDERETKEPWSTLFSVVAAPTLVGVATIVSFSAFHLLVSGAAGFNGSVVIIVSSIPGPLSFGVITGMLFPRLRLLRSLPLSRPGLAALILGCATTGVLLQITLIALLRILIGANRLPILPLNYVLLWICGAVFLPATVVLFGRSNVKYLVVLLFLIPAFAARLVAVSELGTAFSGSKPLPSVVMATVLCVTAAFFLLRYALLRPRLDWRYAREVQELTSGRST